MDTMIFTNRSQAKKQTKLSYLGGVNKSAKIIKNGKIGMNTYCIYLAPANLSGYNTCSHSTPECRIGCLNTSGRAGIEIVSGKNKILNCRSNKTKLFFEQTSYFMQWVIAEIESEIQKAKKINHDFSVRLNGTSDIDWSDVLINGKTIFELFPNIQFYDYTKNPNKFKNIAKNYHLIMSYTGRNWQVCEMLLQQGFNVAVVFDVKKNKALPKTFNGYKVVDGDITDYRPLDGKGVVVGLRWKYVAHKQVNDFIRQSCFVVKPQTLASGLVTYNIKQTKTVNKNVKIKTPVN